MWFHPGKFGSAHHTCQDSQQTKDKTSKKGQQGPEQGGGRVARRKWKREAQWQDGERQKRQSRKKLKYQRNQRSEEEQQEGLTATGGRILRAGLLRLRQVEFPESTGGREDATEKKPLSFLVDQLPRRTTSDYCSSSSTSLFNNVLVFFIYYFR